MRTRAKARKASARSHSGKRTVRSKSSAARNKTVALVTRPQFDDLDLVHPEMRESTVAALEVFEALPPLSDATLPEFRAMMEGFARPLLDGIPVERRLISGPRGHKIPVVIINARPGTNRPVILHIHGGGFVGGAPIYDAPVYQDIASKLDCVVVSVDYHLAPEVGWRTCVGDCYAALKWVHRNAKEIFVDRSRIVVMGESAGGCLATLVAIEARDRGEVPLALQVLIYPMLDDRTGTSRNMAPHIGNMIWTRESNRYAWRSYLGMKPGGRGVPAAAVPARAANLAGVAPAFIGIGTLDLFIDENLEYAQRLIAAGVPTELHVVPGAVHGFDEFSPESSLVQRFVTVKLDALRRAFGLPVSGST